MDLVKRWPFHFLEGGLMEAREHIGLALLALWFERSVDFAHAFQLGLGRPYFRMNEKASQSL